MAKDVRCSVTTCAYHDQNDCCKAMKFVFQNVIVVRLVKNKKQNVELLN